MLTKITDSNPEMTAMPVGKYQVVVVHMNTLTEKFGCFETEASAVEWATQNRSALGLVHSACWRVESMKEVPHGK
jgi:hypothetical protein